MNELFSNPIWNFLSFVLAAIAFLFSLKQSKRKRLAYSYMPIYQISGKDSIIGNPAIDKSSKFCVVIKNIGNVPITESDFNQPLYISILDSVKINSITQIKSNPDNLNVTWKYIPKERTIEVSPTMLNPNDYFTLEIIHEEGIPKLKITSRIVAIKEVQDHKHLQAKSEFLRMLFCLVLVFLFLPPKNIELANEFPILKLIGAACFGFSIPTIISMILGKLKVFK